MAMPSLTRRSLLAGVVSTTAAATGCSSIPGFDPPKIAGEWPTYQRDARNTGVELAGQEPPINLSPHWAFQTQSQDIAAPAVGESIVYVPTTGRLDALDVEDGTRQWTTKNTGVAVQPILADSKVYMGTDEGVMAYHAATGQRAWKKTEPISQVFSTPAVAEGTVLIGERRPFTSAGRVFAVGGRNWTIETGLTYVWSPTVANGVVYVGTWGQSGIQISTEEEAQRHELIAVDLEDGTVRWRYDAVVDSVSAPAVANGTVLVTTYDQRIHAVDAETGREKWTRRVPVVGASAPVAIGNTVYVGSIKDHVYALSVSDGTTHWLESVNGPVVDGVAVAATNEESHKQEEKTPPSGVVYAATQEGTLNLLDAATGDSLRTIDIGAAASTPPCVHGRTVFVGTDDESEDIQRLHTFRE